MSVLRNRKCNFVRFLIVQYLVKLGEIARQRNMLRTKTTGCDRHSLQLFLEKLVVFAELYLHVSSPSPVE